MVLRLDLGPVSCHLLSFYFKKGGIEIYGHDWKELTGPGHPVLAVWVFLVLDRTFPFGCHLGCAFPDYSAGPCKIVLGRLLLAQGSNLGSYDTRTGERLGLPPRQVVTGTLMPNQTVESQPQAVRGVRRIERREIIKAPSNLTPGYALFQQ